MTKTKTPFFSFGAHGSIADSITAQKRGLASLIRTKPTPTDPRSLAQMYQRWDYQDQAYLWHALTASQKVAQEALARPYHMTGFAYWLRGRLNTLPDIAARWRFDHVINNITSDSSKNSNHATVFGAYQLTGRIDNGLFFDGVDDYLNCGSDDSLHITGPCSVECFIYPTAAQQGILNRLIAYNRAYQLSFHHVVGPTFLIATGSGTAYMSGTVVPINHPYHLLGTYDGVDENGIHIYINGDLADRTLTGTCSGDIEDTSGQTFYINNVAARRAKGWLDHFVVYNRELDATEAKRHSERRYPL